MKKTWIKPVVFFALGTLMFFALQSFFIPDSSSKRSNADKTIKGLREVEENTIDVLFMGTSHIRLGISPMEMYEKTKIKSYNLSTDGQPIEASYFLLKDTFTKQHPSVVVFDVAGVFSENDTEKSVRWRHVLDNYELSPIKLEMARSYGELEAGDGMMSVVFPIMKYHTRWSSLNQSDFELPEPRQFFYTCGETLYSLVQGDAYATLLEINVVNGLQQTPSQIRYFENGIYREETIESKLYEPVISERNLEYLLRMKSLCEENGAELVLTKIPVLRYTQYYTSAWTEQKSEMIKALATEQGLRFLDLLYGVDTGIDWTTDTCDGGFHLNVRGARKVTAAMGTWLLDNFTFPQTDSAQYDKYLALYHRASEVAMLQSETDFHTYLQRLIGGQDKWTVLVSSDEDFALGMDDAGFELLEELGLQLTREAAFRDAYLALIDQGEVKYEAVSGRQIDYSTFVDGIEVSMGSAGWNVGAYCKLEVNGRDYAQNGRGLNFVVYDLESGLVIDAVSFDTSLPTMAASRNGTMINGLLQGYEAKVCFGRNAA